MFLKRMISAWLAFHLCAAWLPAQSTDSRGIYVTVGDISNLGASPTTRLNSALNVAGVDGLLAGVSWASLEPAMGQYQWATLDKWLNQVAANRQQVELAITGGSSSPSWLFQPAPAGAGATPLTFAIAPHEGQLGTCNSITIAAPWDTAYLDRWDALLAAVSAHLKSTAAGSVVSMLRLTGINRSTDELRLPAETPQSTGLACISDSIAIWQKAGYKPALLLQAWDRITGMFQSYFPDKTFTVALIPQSPFPAIGEDGAAIPGTVPDQNQPLVALAAEKFPGGRLVVQHDFLMPGEPPTPQIIQYAQTLGTLIAFQTNDYLSPNGGAACSEPVANPTPCTASTYMTLLLTGIYPEGQGNPLRAHHIEVFPQNAIDFPADIQQAHLLLRPGTAKSSPRRGRRP
jgi:hypothetical protein